MNNGIKIIDQFSIWSVQLEDNPVGHEQGGNRPFFVISSRAYNINSQTPIGFIMSSSNNKSKNNYTIVIPEMENKVSHINITQIRTLDISRFNSLLMSDLKEEGIEAINKFISILIFKNTDLNKSDFIKKIEEII